MSDSINPYQSPTSVLASDESQRQEIIMVGAGRRFLNYIIDLVSYQVVKFSIVFVSVALLGPDIVIVTHPILAFVFGISVMVTYYIVMESVFQKTIGKMVTGTVVVDEYGKIPSTRQVMMRSFIRLVPFEAFSCFGDRSYGWHDRWSETFVVKSQKR
jgi:uncharacterized RDD family membrane protein YckC